MRKIPSNRPGLGLAIIVGASALALASAEAAVLGATDIAVSSPAGSNNSGGAFTDDLLLDSLSYGGTTFSGASGFSAVTRVEVTDGRRNVNAEWGDDDTGADGDANPLSKLGFAPGDQESTDPAIQDAMLGEVFSGRNLTEITDGESGAFSFKVEFARSITDNAAGVDDVPELVIFERGMNDVFDVSLMVGGTFENPVFSDTLRISSRDFWDTGIDVNTREIDGAQGLGVGGFDLDDFGLSFGDAVFGLSLTRVSGGADISGLFLSDAGPGGGTPNTNPVPLPGGLPLILGGFAGLALLRRRAV